MIYPINIFTPDPTGGIRPFIIFIANEYKPNINAMKSWSDAIPMAVPLGGFTLPMPNNGLIDSVTHEYSTANPIANGLINIASDKVLEVGSFLTGMTPDPMQTQVYKGTGPRSYEATWEIVPQSTLESIAVAMILTLVKKFGSPDRIGKKGKAGALVQPCVFKIIFSNPLIDAAMQFDKMAIKSYSINYFAQGYASTYNDMMPKHIQLTLSFEEFGIKYREDWMI